MLFGNVSGLAEVGVQVVKFEHLVVERVGIGCAEGLPRRAVHLGAEQPALVIQRPLAHHLKILGLVVRRFLGIFRIKCIGEAGPLDRRLFDTVNGFGRGNAGDFKYSRHHIDDVHELLAQAAFVLDVTSPGYRHVLANAAKLRGILLEPGERRIEGPGPSRRHVVVGLLCAPDVIPLHLIRNRHADAVEERDFVRCAEVDRPRRWYHCRR